MSFKPVGNAGELSFKKVKDMEKDEVFEGTFIESTEGKYGPEWKFQTKDGNTVVFNGTGALNYKMAQVAINSDVQIIYFGKEELPSGKYAGKLCHKVEVLVDDGVDEIPL